MKSRAFFLTLPESILSGVFCYCSMRCVTLLAVVFTALCGVVANTASAATLVTRETLAGGRTRLVHRGKTDPSAPNLLPERHVALLHPRGAAAVILQHKQSQASLVVDVNVPPTDPPVLQPHGMLFYITDWCQENLQLNEANTAMFNGGWSVPPPAVAASQWSGQIVMGFEAKPVPGNDYINGTTMYQSPQGGIDNIQIAFAAVSGEWMLETVSPTVWGIEIMMADVGTMAIYNIVVGQSHATTPSC